MSVRGVAIGVIGAVVTGVATIALALAASSPEGTPSGEAPEAPVPAGVYAYMKIEFGDDWTHTRSELVVMDGTGKIGSAPFGFVGTRPVFTSDGAYVYTLPLGDELTVISTDDGTVTTVPCDGCSDRHLDCQCQTVVPLGGSRLAWLDGDNRLVHVDLAAGSPAPRQTDITVPTQDGFLDERVLPSLIAGADGTALAAYPSGGLPGDDLLPAYLVTLDEKPRRLDPGRPDSIESAVFSSDGARVALTGNQEYACATVTVVDVASGEGETAPVHAEPGTTCESRDGYIDSMWWDRDGTLNVYFQGDDETSGAEDGQRRLEGRVWAAADAAPATEKRQLSTPGAAVVRADWTLTTEVDGERTRIDTDVRHVTAAPH